MIKISKTGEIRHDIAKDTLFAYLKNVHSLCYGKKVNSKRWILFLLTRRVHSLWYGK